MNEFFSLNTSFPEILHAKAAAADIADKTDLYGRLIGSWQMDVLRHLPDGRTVSGDGEIHFGWVLGGRAIQDVWISPSPGSAQPPQMFGTTLRVYDPGLDAWHIIWSDPIKQYYTRQIGRAEGAEIVQVGTDSRGEKVRWRFTEISGESFHWIGERSPDDNQDWRVEVEFFARRISD